jgi:hypothetical protein
MFKVRWTLNLNHDIISYFIEFLTSKLFLHSQHRNVIHCEADVTIQNLCKWQKYRLTAKSAVWFECFQNISARSQDASLADEFRNLTVANEEIATKHGKSFGTEWVCFAPTQKITKGSDPGEFRLGQIQSSKMRGWLPVDWTGFRFEVQTRSWSWLKKNETRRDEFYIP